MIDVHKIRFLIQVLQKIAPCLVGREQRNTFTVIMCYKERKVDPWRNGSASDSRSEGCVFDSRRVQFPCVFNYIQ